MRRQVEGFERRHVGAHPPGRQADQTPLAKDVDAEPVLRAHLMGKVQRPVLEEGLLLDWTEDLEHEFFHMLRGQDFARRVLQFALEPQLGWLAHLQMQIVRMGLDGGFEVLVQLGLFTKRLLCVQRLFGTHTPVNSNPGSQTRWIALGGPTCILHPSTVSRTRYEIRGTHHT